MRTRAVALAAFSCHNKNKVLHPWLPGKSKRGDIDKLVDSAQSVNISKFAFLRHGNTAPSRNGIDFDRILTDPLGKEQALEAGESFGKQKLLPIHRHVLVSPAPRTVETAQLFLEAAGVECELRLCQSLYDGTMQPKGSALFRQLGYAPLKKYLNHEDEEFRSDARAVLGAYAHSFLDSAMDFIEKDGGTSTDQSTTMLMVGHAIYLPSAALGLASLVPDCKGIDLILSCNTKEAEGYLIDIKEKQVTLLERPSN